MYNAISDFHDGAAHYIRIAGIQPRASTSIVELPLPNGESIEFKVVIDGRSRTDTPGPEIADSPSDQAFNNAAADYEDHVTARHQHCAESTVHRANRFYNSGRQSKATKTIASNGTAPRDRHTADNLRAMHGHREEKLRFHEQKVDKIIVTAQQCYDALYKDAGSANAPTGFYGWSPQMLIHDRGLDKTD